MQSQLAIFSHPALGPSVDARQLYPLLVDSKSTRDIFSDWFLDIIRRAELVAGVDYVNASYRSGQGREKKNYIVSLPAAVRIAKKSLKRLAAVLIPYLESYGQAEGPTSSHASTQSPPRLPGFSPNGGLPATANPGISFNGPTAPIVAPNAQTPALLADRLATAPFLAPIETKAQRLRRELKEAEEEEAWLATVQPAMVDGDALTRLATVEGKVDALLLFFQQATHTLTGLTPAVLEPLPTRTRLNRLVDGYVAKTKADHQQVWRYLYGQLATRCGFDVYAQAAGRKDPVYLDIVEEAGQVEQLYTLAKAALVVPAKQ